MDSADRLPPIETPRLHLRLLTADDAGALQAMTDDPAVTDIVDVLPTPFTRAAAMALILGDGDGRDRFMGAWEKAGGALVAAIGIHLRGDAEIEIGYWVSPSAQGRGIATEAVSAAIAAVRMALPERRLIAECRIGNRASWGLLEKLGFRATGGPGRRAGRRRLVLAG